MPGHVHTLGILKHSRSKQIAIIFGLRVMNDDCLFGMNNDQNSLGRGMTATNVEGLRTMIVFLEITRNSPITPLEIPCLTLRCCR